MFKILAAWALVLCMVGCGGPAGSSQGAESSTPQPEAVSTPAPTQGPEETPAPEATQTPAQAEEPDQAEGTPAQDESVQTQTETETETKELAYGAIPFDLAAETGTWWSIDSTDSAYWAVQENINAIRAEVGLPALTMDDSLSAAASARCESFVAGGAFDHSGMTTSSEILAAGPLRSASEVCKAWKDSPDHYANITNPNFTTMGVSCWFCDTDQGQYTYWAVTFG